MQIVTFDFHNTVARCDPWFELEIRTLPAAVLARMNGQTANRDAAEHATARYRNLRKQVIATGVEHDAQTCVARVFQDLGISYGEADLAQGIETLMQECLPALSPVPGAVETISSLVDSGTPVGIVSSAVYHPFLEWALDRFGIRDRLAFVATSASIGHYKSVPAVYERAYALACADPTLGVHVGDSPRWDIDTAQRAGLAAVLYEPGQQKAPLDDSFTPDLILETLVDAQEPLTALLEQRRARPIT